MLTTSLHWVEAKAIWMQLIMISLVVSGIGLLSGGVAYGGGYAAASPSGAGQCEFSLMLQQPSQREEYIGELALQIGNYWALNEDVAVMSDASVFNDLGFGKADTADFQDYKIDSFSVNCLSCHDGISASDIHINYINSPGGFRTQERVIRAKRGNHPIGMDYERYVALGNSQYKPISSFNSNMYFIEGKVGCLTCHDPLNPERNHLVMSDYGSALCLTCHNKG